MELYEMNKRPLVTCEIRFFFHKQHFCFVTHLHLHQHKRMLYALETCVIQLILPPIDKTIHDS